MTTGLTKQLTQQEYDMIINFVTKNLEEMKSHDEEYEELTPFYICNNFLHKNYGNMNNPQSVSIQINKWNKNRIPQSLQDFIQKELNISLEM
ncbi:hypothetical protein ORI89_19060 [Sphingobacterium sp. UT-1RO-CII-1]|uniref:hypothetical protein n=1 Tax=Sphingobacterium sp. UT-1RO-CII-1 TaxID=2995225 RepID=UPI00227B2143|nr:hypothetical protein [Sphingobacterium sp. UT-1RO-CII-1]MCY4781754.1 hypothetical protein [Sphingobacterium sp. UT-1RO-CII-1]